MPISRFPRYGFRIAPDSLRELLDRPLPRPFRTGPAAGEAKLCDLDEKAWAKYSPDECHQLGKLVVETVHHALAKKNMPTTVAWRRTPPPPEGLALEELELHQRTYNCLRNLLLDGRLAHLADLSRLDIGALLRIKGFGVKSLVDLLTTLESQPKPTRESQPKPTRERNSRGEVTSEDLLPEGNLSLHYQLGRVRHLRLPQLPAGVTLADLNLVPRTYVCLEKQGYGERPHDLDALTVEQVLQIPRFGERSLIDYVVAVERCRKGDRADEKGESLPAALAAENLFLEDELRALLSERRFSRVGAFTQRNADCIIEYFGLDGRGGVTLSTLGEKHRITRERVRQICAKAAHSLKRLSSIPPLLQRALDAAARHLPADAAALEAHLQQEGLTRDPFRLEGLINAAKLFNRVPPFHIEVSAGRRMVVLEKPRHSRSGFHS